MTSICTICHLTISGDSTEETTHLKEIHNTLHHGTPADPIREGQTP